jgi:glucan phosphoethanolaminetransferase (alkaline phosphatase superfamily)
LTHLKLDMRTLLNWASSQFHVAWQFRLPILASLFLLSPVLVFDVGLSILNGRGVDKLTLFAIPASVFWLMAMYGLIRNVWVAHLALFPFYALTIADLHLISHFDMRLTSSTISVILENSDHAVEFARTLSPLEAIALLILIASFGLLTFGMRGLRVQSWRCLKVAAIGLVLTYASVSAYRIYFFGGNVSVGITDVLAHDRNSPFGVFPQSYIAYQVYEDAIEHQRHAGSFTFGAIRRTEPEESEVYVLVVGESSRRDHWSLFGYSRPTTLRIAHTANIVPFEDMVAQEALTQVSVPLMITRRSIEHPQAHLNEKSIVSAFKEAGFRTFWLSTQQRDRWTGAINRYSSEADHVAFFERRLDMVLVDALREIMNKRPNQNEKQKLFVVLHTQGSHFVYSDRYSETTAPFNSVGTEKERIIAEYDNSIDYTDQMLSQLISTLSEYRGLTALLYLSDHGENLYDDKRMLLGHMLNNEYDIPIPAFLWTSRSYAAQQPGMLEAAKRNAARPLNTRVVFSTLAQIAGVEIPGMEMDKLSVVSDGLEPCQRFFNKQGTILDYDKWIRSSRLQARVR